MRAVARFFTRQSAADVLASMGDALTARQIRTLAQNGIVRPLYRPSGDAALDSSLYGLEELALLHLWARLEAMGIPYVQRALTLERVGEVVRQAVRHPGAADDLVVVFDRQGGRVLSAGQRGDGAIVRESLGPLIRRVLKVGSSVRDVWSGHAWSKHSEVAAQLACA